MNILKQMVINYFNLGLYTASDLTIFVAAGWISQADVDQVTKTEQSEQATNSPSPSF